MIDLNLFLFFVSSTARQCISLEKFLFYVALPALVNACDGGVDTEIGARLSCHLLLRLFKTIEIVQKPASPSPLVTQGPSVSIKLNCDRHLLAAVHKNMAVGPVLAVLKGILVVADATGMNKAPLTPSTASGGKKRSSNSNNSSSNNNNNVQTRSASKGDLSHILGTSDPGATTDVEMVDVSK